ncbi:MAG TPA: hypothetical protein VD994_05950 [Prosthecobacter sp.]|nr:hypothetical protein [Prosthecobacter sp.]
MLTHLTAFRNRRHKPPSLQHLTAILAPSTESTPITQPASPPVKKRTQRSNISASAPTHLHPTRTGKERFAPGVHEATGWSNRIGRRSGPRPAGHRHGASTTGTSAS